MNPNKCEDCGLSKLPPGHVAVPIAKLESLRDSFHITTEWHREDPLPRAIDRVLSHLPPKVDHVALLRRLAKDSCPHGQERAALEAAIKALEAQR